MKERGIGAALNLPVGQKRMDFIAQEVASVVPHAVVPPKDPSKDPYAMKDGVLVALLVEAVKAQQAEIDGLTAEVAALEARP